jgi:uncharacterized coiled-coil protein SlyX
MNININIYNHEQPHENPTPIERGIIMKLSEIFTINTSLAGQLNKVEAEVVAQVAALRAAIDQLTADLTDVTLTAEQAQSITDLQTIVQKLDDLNPDLIPEPVEPPVEPVVTD